MRRGLFAQTYTSAVNPGREPADKPSTAQLFVIRPAPGDKEFTMTVTSLSFTLVNTYAPQSARPATVVERKTPPVQSDDAACGEKRPASRENRLVQAMMSALRELGFGGTAAPAAATSTTAATPVTGAVTPATTTATASNAAATPAPSTTATPAEASSAADSSATVESAVHQFAHELFQALRQSRSDNPSSEGDSGRGEGHHRHHHHEAQGHGYGNMAQRLEALSQTFGAPAAAAAAATTDTKAAAAEPTSTSLSVTLTVNDGAADAPASASATPAATAATTTASAAAPAKNPLLEAFTKLFNALKPPAVSTQAASAETDMAEKLRQFLHTLAQAVAPDAANGMHRAQPGALVNVTA